MRSEGGPATGDTDATLAYEYAGDTYDFYWTYFGRDSYDNAGAQLTATVHYCPSASFCPYENAFWNGIQMVYGEGFAAADDVVAHELTHAVTEYSAGLYYYMQSGALNESFSDIFGETVDLLNGAGTDTPGVRWALSEDLSIGAIRHMLNPNTKGDPGRVGDSFFACADPGGDGGGVHSNSGVPNHAFALMSDGGLYNGFNITGIGLEDAARVQYRALTVYLTSASDFLDNYNALNQACADLVGVGGITTADVPRVKMALDSVQMDDPWPCAPLQAAVPALCEDWQTVSNLFFDDLENTGSGKWVRQTLSGTTHWVYPIFSDFFATSGTQCLWGDDISSAADSTIRMTTDVFIPVGDCRMQFNHSYGFENSGSTYYDGGVLEFSTNAGSSWVDAGSLITAGARYGGTIAGGFSNPLAGRSGFVRESYGYTASQLNLASLAGRSVRFRFRMGTDASVGDYGWFIDDVRIYRCLAIPGNASLAFNPTNLTPSITFGENAPSQNFEIWNSTSGALQYTISTNVPWLSIAPASGVSTGEHDTIQVNYKTDALSNGQYYGQIILNASASNAPQSLAVTLTVTPRVAGHYYVNDNATTLDAFCTSTGQVGNSGLSPGAPKNTVQGILSGYNLEPGDLVYIDTGNYTLANNIAVTNQDGGSPGAPVTFIASPYGVTFNRNNPSGTNNFGFQLAADYVTLRTGDSSNQPSAPQRYLQVSNAYAGVHASGKFIRIERVDARANYFYGIYLGGQQNTARNCLARNTTFASSASGIVVDGLNATVENCTVFENGKYGIRALADCILRNNIVIANGVGDFALYESITNAAPNSNYNDLIATNNAYIGYSSGTRATLADWTAITGQDEQSLSLDPLFVSTNSGDFHLRSSAPTGTYIAASGVWSNFPGQDSPGIDAGDPASAFTNEPPWNGNVINLGAYGNTPWASRSADSDGDGLSNTYEDQRAGTSASIEDTDGDGMPDGDEVGADTSPTNPASLLRVDVFGMTGGVVTIAWRGGSNVFQHLEYSRELQSTQSPWTRLLTLRPLTATSTNLQLPASTNQTGYYRIRTTRQDDVVP